MRVPSFLIQAVLVGVAAACIAGLPSLARSQAKPPAAPGGASGSPVPRTRASSPPAERGSVRFREAGTAAGLTTMPASSDIRQYIVDVMGGGGVALLDCDNDGRLDIAVVNDSSIERNLKGGDPMLTLYRQDSASAGVHFTDITRPAGLTVRGWGMGVAAGDFDNDGRVDIYVTGYGHNVLYRSLGACKFEDVTAKAGVAAGGFSTGAAWADYDRDGNLDLFVTRYVASDIRHLPPAPARGSGVRSVIFQVPDEMEGETDFLFRNRGDGTFEDVSKKAGVDDPQKRRGMGVIWGDYDNDGWPDLFVTNDAGANYLYHNRQNGTFEDEGFQSGTALGESGEIFGNMAADFSDYDRDGKIDLFVTRYGEQPPSLFRNETLRAFRDVTCTARLCVTTPRPVKWGTGFADFDNDGWPDLLLANGSFSSQIDALNLPTRFLEPIQFFDNLHNGAFADLSSSCGLNDGTLHSRRGTAFGDVNNDGNVDAVIFNVNAPPSLFLNETRNDNHRVLLRLIGSRSNRGAIGARVTVTAGRLSQAEEVRAGGSYLSTNDTRLSFGLGSAPAIDRVEIAWPSGAKQQFENVRGDAIYEVREDGDLTRSADLPPPAPSGS